jgi:hypothetical protein
MLQRISAGLRDFNHFPSGTTCAVDPPGSGQALFFKPGKDWIERAALDIAQSARLNPSGNLVAVGGSGQADCTQGAELERRPRP